jgi:hypothetical protein
MNITQSQRRKENCKRINRRKAKWVGHILRRNCVLKHVIEGKIDGRIEVTGRLGKKCKSY